MTPNTNKDRADVYQRITEQIVEAIERGADQWTMPWHTSGAIPSNAATGKHYRGVNVLTLWANAAAEGYRSGLWATYAQWRELGAQVRKAEKSTLIVFWKFRDPSDGSESSEDEQNDDSQTAKRGPLARGYNVFNADQVDGFELPAIPVLPQAERIATADSFFARLQADIRHGGNRAFYSPAGDFIQMPPFDIFQDPIAYYATLGHECIHLSGAPHRLNRDLKSRFGDEAYAGEELVAELGAAFLCADLGLANEPRPDHAAYVQSWLRVLRNDYRAIFTAASKAQAAADWLHSFQPAATSTVPAEELPRKKLPKSTRNVFTSPGPVYQIRPACSMIDADAHFLIE